MFEGYKVVFVEEYDMRVNPYLLFDGNCEEALGSYAKILGGKIVAMMPYEASPAADNTVDEALWHARTAYDCGVRRVWFGQRYDLDALTLSAVVGASVPDLRVGTAIVPIKFPGW